MSGNAHKRSPGPLFDMIPHSRTKDPLTSDEAAEGHRTSGNWGGNLAMVADALARHSGSTGRELAEIIGLEYHEVYRRLADLKNYGSARHGESRFCAIAKKKCVTWESK